jgi:CRP/FNR family cyclic AMP-dependent transcriptional regulator
MVKQTERNGVVASDVERYLLGKASGKAIQRFRRRDTIFSQGEPADAAFFLIEGSVQMSILSGNGKEAVVAMAGARSLIGEQCLDEGAARSGSAVALEAVKAVRLERREMRKALAEVPGFSDFVISQLLLRAQRIEASLADQLFYSSEMRLARVLTELAGPSYRGGGGGALPRVSQETLAAMVGTTRSRISYFMNKFRRAGLIEYGKGIVVRGGLLESMPRE